MSKIYISVLGGCINGVVSTNKDDTIEIWDWDNIKCETKNTEKLEREWDEIVKKNYAIF